MNIWVCNLASGILGYTTYPGAAAASDGVVVATRGFGRIGNVSPPYQLGRTVTHEVGHWLNLMHIWGSGPCGNDNVSDTPPQGGSNSGCPAFPHVTCSNGPNGDMFDNYMDYSDDPCMNIFSKGQAARMAATLNGPRASLKTSNGCTPINAAPVANFIADVTTSCNGVIQFTDKSGNAPTSWTWDFGDGNSSTLQNPAHAYLSNNTYTVKLTATNSYGNNQQVKTSYVTINMQTAPTVTGDTRCGAGVVNLSASGSGSLEWYDSSSGGNLLTTGTAYSPTLSTTTTYYVKTSTAKPTVNVGPPTNTFGANALFTSNDLHGLLFDVLVPCRLKTVKVYAGAAGNRTIEVLNAFGGNVLFTKTINIPAGESRITLNFDLPAGNQYFIKVTGATIDLTRNSGGAGYPFTVAGLLSITETDVASTSPGYYYFFYDWEVQDMGCASALVPVTGTINVPPAKPIITQNGSVLSTPAGFTYQWYFNGVLIPSATNQNYSPTQSGNYTVKITDTGSCSTTSDVYPYTATGLYTLEAEKGINVYPNPFNTNFTLKISNETILKNAMIKIYDISGREVKNVLINNNETTIDRGDLQSGIYFYSIINNNKKIANSKLIVQ